MGAIADLIAEVSPQLPLARARGDLFLTLFMFRSAVQEQSNFEVQVECGLYELVNNRDPMQCLLWLEAAIGRPTTRYVSPLCGLLAVKEAYIPHELVIELLGEIRDPRAVPTLEATCSFDANWDAFRSIPQRSLEALLSIGTAEALTAIEGQRASPWLEVREHAERLLYKSDK